MIRIASFLALLSLVAFTSGQRCNPSLSPQGYLLSFQWPISYCYRTQRCSLPGPRNHDWTIHGLWPQFNRSQAEFWSKETGSAFPQYCCHPQRFNLSQLEPTITFDLVRFWPSLKPESRSGQTAFWRHQWAKHGTCFRDPSSQLPVSLEHYFRLALDLAGRFPIRKWLARNRIVPSNSKTYSIESIHRAIESSLGGHRSVSRLECDSNTNDFPSLLSEVQLCFDANLDLIRCKTFFYERNDHECGNTEVLWPSS